MVYYKIQVVIIVSPLMYSVKNVNHPSDKNLLVAGSVQQPRNDETQRQRQTETNSYKSTVNSNNNVRATQSILIQGCQDSLHVFVLSPPQPLLLFVVTEHVK